MGIYSLSDFIKNLSSITNDKYFYEVLLTDFFCLYKNINPEIIYITQEINDGLIDSIVIPKNSNLGSVNVYFIQITTANKGEEYLQKFKDIDPYSIKQYKNILPPKKDINEIKVLISFYEKPFYEKFKDEIEIICSENLFKLFFENSIRYNLLLLDNRFKENFLENVFLRVYLWTYLHRIKAYDSDVINYYIYFFTLNINFIKNGDFKLLDNLFNISLLSNKDIINVFKKIDKNKHDILLYSDYSLVNLIVKTYKCSNKVNNNIVDLAIFLDSFSKFYSPKDFKIIPTKEYLSVYYNDTCIAYMPYNFHSMKNKKACFSFKCDFDVISKLGDKNIDQYIKSNDLISTKLANTIMTGLKHSGMNTTLRHPDIINDPYIVEILLKLSIPKNI